MKSEPRIGRDEARAIAKAHVAEHLQSEVSGSVDAVHETLTANLNVYKVGDWPDRCWVAYLPPAHPGHVRSSEVVVISMETGEVLYAGSANDEG